MQAQMARRNKTPQRIKPRRGWHRVVLPNVPNPWRELLTGLPSTVSKIDDWLAENTSGKCEQFRYNTWDFKSQEDALLFTLTWG
jgi:hypothetical protein